MTASHSDSSAMFTSIRSRRIPALLTRTSRRPKWSTACWIIAPAASKSATLAPLATASPPMASISATTCWAGVGVLALAGHVAAQVVDHDLGALLGQHQGVLPPDAPAGAGDHADPAFTDPAHLTIPVRRNGQIESWRRTSGGDGRITRG